MQIKVHILCTLNLFLCSFLKFRKLLLLHFQDARGQHDLNRIAQGVHNGVNLGASAAATDADALINLGLRPDSVWLLAGAF